MKYSSQLKVDYLQIVSEINDTLLELVLGTMINKSGFQNIFGELKKQFRESQTVTKSNYFIINTHSLKRKRSSSHGSLSCSKTFKRS